MTFGEAGTILRRDVLAEQSTAYYTDESLLGYLGRAARELAYSFGFPTAVDLVAVASGDSTFDLPADAANLDLNEVAFDGFILTLVPYRVIVQYVEQASVGLPRYYNYDPKRGDRTVYFAPKAPRGANVTFEYVQVYDPETGVPPAIDPLTDIWQGLFPAFHDIVIFRAAVKAFDASLETDRSGYWFQREQARMQEFALFLNKVPVERALGEGANES